MKILKTLLLVVMSLLMANFVLAQAWTQTSALTNNWYSVASSADGTKLVAVNYDLPYPWLVLAIPIYTSTNSGITWQSSDWVIGNILWRCAASSADGTKLFAANENSPNSASIYFGPFYTSSDSGITWTFPGAFSSLPDFGGWVGVSSSADGSKLVAVGSAGAYISADFGTNWTASPSSGGNLTCVASSADGTKLVAGSIFDNSVYISTNSGADWRATDPTNELWWGSVASSADGSKLVAAVYASSVLYSNGTYINIGGPIYTSADSGTTWTLTSAPNMNWQSVASSAEGTRLVAAADGGLVYTSTDSGTNWAPADMPNMSWQSVAISADGNKLVAAAKGGGIWASQAMPSPRLNLAPSSTSLALSWTIPSTNFVLQQSADLTSWVDVTNEPALDLTNLQNEVTLSPSNSSCFYRLKTP